MNQVQSPEVRLGNDIARQFAHLDDEAAVAAIAAHMVKFWEPRMRASLRRQVEAGETDVDPRVAAAAARL